MSERLTRGEKEEEVKSVLCIALPIVVRKALAKAPKATATTTSLSSSSRTGQYRESQSLLARPSDERTNERTTSAFYCIAIAFGLPEQGIRDGRTPSSYAFRSATASFVPWACDSWLSHLIPLQPFRSFVRRLTTNFFLSFFSFSSCATIDLLLTKARNEIRYSKQVLFLSFLPHQSSFGEFLHLNRIESSFSLITGGLTRDGRMYVRGKETASSYYEKSLL